MNKLKILILVFVLVAPSIAWAQSDPPEWTACTADTDCTITTGRCSFDWAINKQFLAQANEAVIKWESCLKTGTPDPDAVAKCVNDVCVIEGKN
jgi:hypothetical protein